MPALSFLHRDHSIAPPGFNRWRVPPSALAIHLAVGQAYAFSVFNLPLTRQLGITASAPGDWSLATVAWVFSTAIVFLGLSAALFGKWLERVGPRAAMFASALCFSSGFWVAALGVMLHQFWLLVFGYGVLGGVGLGIGYISPVSTLIKWFPDRPGMATGMAIMGFGGGAMIGSPLGVNLMKLYAGPHATGVAPAFVTMGVLYLAFMMFGVFTVRLPATAAAGPAADAPPAQRDHTVDEAFRTPQFWLLWLVLFVNVTAGIGILSQASPMIQEMFPRSVSPAAAAGFVGLLSLFNLAGRFGWSSLSDFLGRQRTYFVYFLLGIALYAAIPVTGRLGSVPLFVGCCAVIMSMYGGGFSTIPAYLRDLFGTSQVGAIHGRLLTAWSAAGVAGPLLISSLREYQRQHGVPSTEAYSTTMFLLAGLLGVGLISNLLVRPVATRSGDAASSTARARSVAEKPAPAAGVTPALLLGWLVVGMPLAWGIWETFKKSLALFH